MFIFLGVGVADSVSGGKFWEVQVIGSEMTTAYGKLGDAGNTSTKDLGDEAVKPRP